jgi:hypothetical protein
VKFLLPALLIGVSTAHAEAASPPHFLLLYPKATIETDAAGHCTKLTNLSEGIVYVPLTKPLAEVTKALSGSLVVENCAPR